MAILRHWLIWFIVGTMIGFVIHNMISSEDSCASQWATANKFNVWSAYKLSGCDKYIPVPEGK